MQPCPPSIPPHTQIHYTLRPCNFAIHCFSSVILSKYVRTNITELDYMHKTATTGERITGLKKEDRRLRAEAEKLRNVGGNGILFE